MHRNLFYYVLVALTTEYAKHQ